MIKEEKEKGFRLIHPLALEICVEEWRALVELVHQKIQQEWLWNSFSEIKSNIYVTLLLSHHYVFALNNYFNCMNSFFHTFAFTPCWIFNIQSYILNKWIKTITNLNCHYVFFILAPSKQVASVEHWHSITRFSIIPGTAHSQLNLISDVFTPFLWAWFLKKIKIIIIICICKSVCKAHWIE